MTGTLLSIGHGYSAQALATILLSEGWEVIGTTRSPEKIPSLRATGAEAIVWDGGTPPDILNAIARATHILTSVSPNGDGDPVLADLGAAIGANADGIEWVGYLSTTGVYGDHHGGWVDEETPLEPSTTRGRNRVTAENQWRAFARDTGLPLHVFRLAGIYGPGRGPFSKIISGTARRIVKKGQVFSRVHVEDIARVLAASIARPNPGTAYNVCDDDPAPPEDVIAYAADLLGMPRPPEVAFEQADMSAMARSFYAESKRVSNNRIKRDLGISLKYPDYRVGLAALAQERAED